jgi:hypothetical protein
MRSKRDGPRHVIVSVHCGSRARSASPIMLTLFATFHLALCGFRPYTHDGLPGGHHQHLTQEGDAPPDHAGHGDHHVAACETPATH